MLRELDNMGYSYAEIAVGLVAVVLGIIRMVS